MKKIVVFVFLTLFTTVFFYRMFEAGIANRVKGEPQTNCHRSFCN
jgi:hypothetical protein